MFQINPLSGALAQSAEIQRQQSADKAKQARRAKELEKNVAARDDEMEYQVENSEELREIHEEGRQSEQRKKPGHRPGEDARKQGEGEQEGLDLTA